MPIQQSTTKNPYRNQTKMRIRGTYFRVIKFEHNISTTGYSLAG